MTMTDFWRSFQLLVNYYRHISLSHTRFLISFNRDWEQMNMI